ncbi:MAG: DUF2178 domain-containing protein [Patescibacteria group bacterium]
MTLKQYTLVRIIAVITVASSISISVARSNFIIPIFITLLAVAGLFFLRGRVKEILADERDYTLGGTAARLAIQIYSWAAIIAMFVLYSQRALNPTYEVIASVLAYSTCVLMLLYSLIFKYYDQAAKNKRAVFLALAIAFLLVLAVFGIRLFSGEDDWICRDGQWIKHGQPDFLAPSAPCR